MITGSLAKLTCPLDTEKSVELKLAIPLFVSEASSPAIVIVLFVTVVSIPSPAANVRVSVRRFTVSVVPDSAAIERTVATFTVPAAVKRPCASTVNVGICVVEPYEPAVTAVSLSLIVGEGFLLTE